jgi:plastocyanin
MVAGLAVLVLVMPAAAVTTTKLRATVGPGFTISLTNAAGKRVTSLKRGVYEIAVTDRSRMHNFHLSGPGLSWRFTAVGFTGSETIVLTLKPGTYRFVCDPHAVDMRGSFRVT